MTALIVIGVILVIIAVICMLRVGVRGIYAESGPELFLRVGPKSYRLYPVEKTPEDEEKRRRKSEKRAGKKAKKAAKSGEAKEPARRGGSFDLFRKLLPVVLDTIVQFHRRLSIELLEIDFTAASDDPAKAAMSYGYANAALGMVVPVLESRFNVRERRINIDVDFSAQKPRIYVRASLSLMVWEILYIACRFGVKTLKSGALSMKKVKSDIKEDKTVNDNTENTNPMTGKAENEK